jgi:hypothetical protein
VIIAFEIKKRAIAGTARAAQARRVRGGRRFASSGHDDPGREQMQAIVSTIGRAALRRQQFSAWFP